MRIAAKVLVTDTLGWDGFIYIHVLAASSPLWAPAFPLALLSSCSALAFRDVPSAFLRSHAGCPTTASSAMVRVCQTREKVQHGAFLLYAARCAWESAHK